MQVIGNYIAITKPKVMNNFVIDTNEERLLAANVIDCSPDVNVPFGKFAVVFISRGRIITIDGFYFVDISHIPLWIAKESLN